MASLIVILLIVPLVLRGYARRVEAGAGDAPDKVHRIRRAQTAAILALPVLEVVMLAEAYGEGRLLLVRLPAWHGAPVAVGALLVFFALFIGGAVLCYLAAYPATARIRGLPSRAGRAGRRQARMLLVMLAPQLIWVALWAVTHVLHGVAELAVLPLWIAYLVGVVVFFPKLIRAMLPTRPVDADVRRRLLRLAGEHEVKVRDIRCLDTGPEQMANAMLMGLLPRSRYVLITDRLLRELEPDELDAVLAHELGHAKRHHLLIKLGAMLVTWLPAAGLAVIAALSGHRSVPLAAALMILAMVLVIASLVVVQGLVGVRLERSADDYASATAGPDALRRGLEKLAAANAMKRRTGRMWNLLTQHPGLDQRVDRLRKGAAREAQPAG
jgi:Zn-dependent protease with chaperone function